MDVDGDGEITFEEFIKNMTGYVEDEDLSETDDE